jgi:hypothetical protein
VTTALPNSSSLLAEIAREHDRLGVIVERFSDACTALESGQKHVDPRPVTCTLELELFRHFAAEEAEDHFERIVRERPALLHRVSELRAEHAAILRTVSELVAMAADKSRRHDMGAVGARFVAEFRRHEDKENALLQEFVLRDEGTSQD